MTKYLEIREAALNDKASNSKERGIFGRGFAKQTINGVEFACTAIQQSYNGATAVQVLHYIDGKKVSKTFFVDAISQLH